MGPGVGLEVGNSIYFDMPPDQFAYWNTDDAGREMVRALIRSGHIDCLHSYGDLATTRQHAARALDELDRHGCRLEVWVDHGTAVTNFGSDIMRGHGDEVGHEAYHADLTTRYGIKILHFTDKHFGFFMSHILSSCYIIKKILSGLCGFKHSWH